MKVEQLGVIKTVSVQNIPERSFHEDSERDGGMDWKTSERGKNTKVNDAERDTVPTISSTGREKFKNPTNLRILLKLVRCVTARVTEH